MAALPIPIPQVMEQHECPECGIVYFVPKRTCDERRRVGGSITCPNGHVGTWKESETERLHKALESARADQNWWKARADARDKELVRLKKRVGNGICPYCKRSFTALARHIHDKHPGRTA